MGFEYWVLGILGVLRGSISHELTAFANVPSDGNLRNRKCVHDYPPIQLEDSSACIRMVWRVLYGSITFWVARSS